MVERKTILVIGAGWEQFQLLKTIKDEGHKIIATHPFLNADGFKLADVTYVKDSRDIKSHLRIAQTHKVDAIVTDNCDFSLYTAAVLASKLGLPFTSIQSAIYSNDKFSQREACKKGGVLQPDFHKVRTLEELLSASKSIGFPLIVKPIDSRGTFGVTVVTNREELETAYYDAVDQSHSRVLICEKFIRGTLVTVDGFCFRNGHRSLAVASRKFEKGAKPVTKEIIYPALFSKQLNDKLLRNHELVVSALGYQYGHTHGEYIVTDDEQIYLVECANRGGGVYTSSVIVPLLTGIDLNRILLNQSLGSDVFEIGNNVSDHGYMTKSAMLTFLDFEVGKVVKNINLEEVRALPFTVRFRSIYSENDMIESIENCASRHSMLVIEGEDTDRLLENFDLFKEKLKLEYHS
jgi:biotin carboxylase